MDEARARELLGEVARRLGPRAVLWRGQDLRGSDVDLLVLPDGASELSAALGRAGLSPRPGDPGHVVWSAADAALDVDVFDSASWPRYYPSLDGVLARTAEEPGLPPVASPEDRLLMLAAEAVAGRPLAKVERRARALLAAPGARDRVVALARSEGLEALGAAILDPAHLSARGRRGRLPYGSALSLALRCGPARAALRARLVSRVGARRSRRRGLLVTLSGMDGAGKSTVAGAAVAHLHRAGLAATVSWGRFAGDTRTLDQVAGPLKRLLGRRGTIADPVAAGGSRGPSREPRGAAPERTSGAVAWVWVLFLAALSARQLRRAARPGRRGQSVVCDRWLADALVDLRLRYGRHRIGERLLSLAAPSADLSILLEIDAASAFARKSDDQADWVLGEMERHYAAVSDRLGLARIDAGRPAREVAAEIGRRIDELLAVGRAESRSTRSGETAPPGSSAGS